MEYCVIVSFLIFKYIALALIMQYYQECHALTLSMGLVIIQSDLSYKLVSLHYK